MTWFSATEIIWLFAIVFIRLTITTQKVSAISGRKKMSKKTFFFLLSKDGILFIYFFI